MDGLLGTQSINYVTAGTLAQWLDSRPKERFAIVDVRDDDFAGGHIPGAMHYASRTFHDNLPYIVDAVKDEKKIIVHCMQSAQRGPSCARVLREKLPEDIEVYVLRGGFSEWRRVFADKPERLAEDDQACWASDGGYIGKVVTKTAA